MVGTSHVATFSNTVDVIGFAVRFLRLVPRLELRRINSRWDLAVRESAQHFTCTRDVLDADLDTLAASFPEVRTLSLSHCKLVTATGLSHLLQLGALTSLDLSATKGTDDAAMNQVARLAAITSLNISFCHFVSDVGIANLSSLRNLQSLQIRGFSRISATVLQQLALAHPNLTTLGLSGHLMSSLEGLRPLASFRRLTSLMGPEASEASLERMCALHTLTELDLSPSDCLTNEGVAMLCGCLRKLRVLNVGGCCRVGDACLESVSCNLDELHTLNVSFCWNVTDTGLAMIGKMEGLTALDVSGCSEVSDVGVLSLARLSRLRSLVIHSCDNLTVASHRIISDRLVSLTHLDGGNYTDAGRVCLSRLPALEKLTLRLAPVAAVPSDRDESGPLCGFRRLSELSLKGPGNSFTVGFFPFCRMPSLEVLRLHRAKLPNDVRLALRASNHALRVIETG